MEASARERMLAIRDPLTGIGAVEYEAALMEAERAELSGSLP